MSAASILAAPTPESWIDHASANLPTLLVDHAACEKKAASTALALMFAYPEDSELALALARLAREELRHFEQVEKLMRRMGVPFERQRPGRYGGRLRAAASSAEPRRKLDLMLIGALIEARSCERFERLAPRLPAPYAEFYSDLARAEARHYELYLDFARRACGGDESALDARLRELAVVEADLATAPDAEFRFHSGAPLDAAPPAPSAMPLEMPAARGSSRSA